jgi:transcription-repair coupling factor (superfamily II helicase)
LKLLSQRCLCKSAYNQQILKMTKKVKEKKKKKKRRNKKKARVKKKRIRMNPLLLTKNHGIGRYLLVLRSNTRCLTRKDLRSCSMDG